MKDNYGFATQSVTNQPSIKDPNNKYYDSFVGVTKLPTGKLTIDKEIGRGNFGEVYEGNWEERKIGLKNVSYLFPRISSLGGYMSLHC